MKDMVKALEYEGYLFEIVIKFGGSADENTLGEHIIRTSGNCKQKYFHETTCKDNDLIDSVFLEEQLVMEFVDKEIQCETTKHWCSLSKLGYNIKG